MENVYHGKRASSITKRKQIWEIATIERKYVLDMILIEAEILNLE